MYMVKNHRVPLTDRSQTELKFKKRKRVRSRTKNCDLDEFKAPPPPSHNMHPFEQRKINFPLKIFQKFFYEKIPK
jgi:hypothetical protein